MPRIQFPWYNWRVPWRNVPWVAVSAGGVCASWLLIRSGSFFAGSLLLLFSLALLWGSSKALWRNRQPFVFAVRGDRKVRFRGAGRDGTILEENGRTVKINTELLVGKTSRAIYAKSIQKYESPYDSEPLTEERREEILDLLCEDMIIALSHTGNDE